MEHSLHEGDQTTTYPTLPYQSISAIITHSLTGSTDIVAMSTEVVAPPLTNAQKATPVYLPKQLCAMAAVVCYDSCLANNSMSTADLQERVYHMYHGDEDLNMVSQDNLLFVGKDTTATYT